MSSPLDKYPQLKSSGWTLVECSCGNIELRRGDALIHVAAAHDDATLSGVLALLAQEAVREDSGK